jgi:hypothetical protein
MSRPLASSMLPVHTGTQSTLSSPVMVAMRSCDTPRAGMSRGGKEALTLPSLGMASRLKRKPLRRPAQSSAGALASGRGGDILALAFKGTPSIRYQNGGRLSTLSCPQRQKSGPSTNAPIATPCAGTSAFSAARRSHRACGWRSAKVPCRQVPCSRRSSRPR